MHCFWGKGEKDCSGAPYILRHDSALDHFQLNIQSDDLQDISHLRIERLIEFIKVTETVKRTPIMRRDDLKEAPEP
jgi:hypothetical protein